MMKGGNHMTDIIRRGDIFYADLRPVVGSEQGGIRPVLILQNDIGNRKSPTTIVVTMTSRINKKTNMPTHVTLHKDDTSGLTMDSVLQCESLRTIDKKRIKKKIGCINEDSLESVMRDIKEAFRISLAF